MNTLRIIGSGVKGAMHITYEALINLNKANKILWLGSIEGFENWVSEYHWQAEDITSLYENGALDSNNYQRIKSKVLFELAQHHDVAFVVLGHPRLGVTIVQEFQNEKGNEIIVLPGISSFDTMINDIALDPIEEGTCLLDVNRLLLYDYNMDPCLNYFIYHICSIGNAKTDYINPNEKNGVSYLKVKLLKHFPECHPLILLSSSGSHQQGASHLEGNIESLKDLLENVTFSSSLFIPAKLPSKNQVNKQFLQHMMGACSA